MITVRGRTLVIPANERIIGTDIDNNSEVRHFRLSRVPGGIDISHLKYYIDLIYNETVYDTCRLDAEVQDEKIILTWTVRKNNVVYPGTVWIAIRARDESGDIKWGSDRAACYVLDTVNTPGNYTGLTDLERYQELTDQAIAKCDEVVQESKGMKEAADQAVKDAGQTLKVAEEAKNTAIKNAGDAEKSAELAEAWAHGKEGYTDQEDDNSWYWSEVSRTQARRAESEANRASMYADFVTPKFLIQDNRLYLKDGGTVAFEVENNRLYFKLPA